MPSRTLYVYWAEHDPYLPPVPENDLHLSARVQQRWKRYRTLQQQNMSLLAKRLLFFGLQQLQWRVGGDLADFCYHPSGKPYLAELPVHFSLSHSKQIAVCVLSADMPVGVDVQEWLPVPPGSEGLFIVTDEREKAGSTDRLTLWSQKEAAYKAVGSDLGISFSQFRFSEPQRVACPQMTLELIPQFIRQGYICCLAVPSPDSLPLAPLQIAVERVLYPY